MPALTKPKIEAVSRFLQALRMCGASYSTVGPAKVTMPDLTEYLVTDSKMRWTFKLKLPDAVDVTFSVRTDLSARKIQLAILSNHVKILQVLS